MSWPGEKQRHGMASRGIPTTYREGMLMRDEKIDSYLATQISHLRRRHVEYLNMISNIDNLNSSLTRGDIHDINFYRAQLALSINNSKFYTEEEKDNLREYIDFDTPMIIKGELASINEAKSELMELYQILEYDYLKSISLRRME